MRQVGCPYINNVNNFQAGNVVNFQDVWGSYTSDQWVLNQVNGVQIPFVGDTANKSAKFSINFDVDESNIMDGEIEKLLKKAVIVESQHEVGQVVSNVFLRPKKDGNFRMVLDLSNLNKVVEYEHFKMSSLKTALELMREGAWMSSVDLRDAYYTVSIKQQDQKYLKFVWKGVLYQFTALPNGLACAHRYFTKMLTPIFAELRKTGNECFFYIDDSFIIA